MIGATDNTPFFLLGAARSGTTMFRLMLNRHSRLAIPFESHFLQPILTELPADRPLEPQQAARMAELVIRERNFRTWHLDAELVRRELVRRAPARLPELVDALYRLETAASGKPRWGDKTPYYYVCWRQMMGLFPKSKLIHIVRDGRDVCRSLQRLGWHGQTLEARARYWLERVEKAQAAALELGAERNLIIRYEDLVLETRRTLEAVCAFLNESFEPQMLAFFTDADRHVSDVDGDVHRKLQRPPRPEDVARWRREMTADEQRDFEAVAASGLRAMSYPCVFAQAASDRDQERAQPAPVQQQPAGDQPPRKGFGSFRYIHEIYYGTDDGYVNLNLREEGRHDGRHVAGLYKIFARYERFHQNVDPARRDCIHFASVIGGLYGLNLIPIFRPVEITFFDTNPFAVAYFQLIRRVWIESSGADEFLIKLTRADYDVQSEVEHEIRSCLAARQNRALTADRGQSARSLLSSWRYALDHFRLTRKLLSEIPVNTRVDNMSSMRFRDFVARSENLWLYCSNVMMFDFFKLHFPFPQNAALFASYFEKTEMLDLAGRGDGPVTVNCALRMTVSNSDGHG